MNKGVDGWMDKDNKSFEWPQTLWGYCSYTNVVTCIVMYG